MNLEEQRKTGIDKINVTDALNASLLELKLEKNANTLSSNSTNLIVYVDYADKSTPSALRREYIFSIGEELKYFDQPKGNPIADKFIIEMRVENNDIFMDTYVKRKLEINETNELSALEIPVYEQLESVPIVLFEGNNYIYTNYEGINIELVYPQNTEENKLIVNSAIYYSHKINNSGDFSLDDIYFKDAFTKTVNKLNLEVDNANISCLTSKNNKFSLDEDGNLTVNSITFNQNILLTMYPVGSIYLSVNSINPSTLFGGTWEQIKDKFLLGAGDTYNGGDTGGSATHILTIDEMPNHSHNIPKINYTVVSSNSTNIGAHYINSEVQSTNSVGGGQAHNNMPPYLTVYIWKRTA